MPLKGLTWARFREHFRKTKWFYIISILVAGLLSNIIYTMTAPRVPMEQEVMFYLVDSYATNEYSKALADAALEYGQTVDETLESVHFESISFSDTNDYYAPMVLTARMSVGDGDVYLCSRAAMDYMSGGEAGEELEEAYENGWLSDLEPYFYEVCDEEGNPTGETHMSGLKLDCVDQMRELGLCTSGEMYVMIANNGTNISTSMAVTEYVVRQLQAGTFAPAAQTSAVTVEETNDTDTSGAQ